MTAELYKVCWLQTEKLPWIAAVRKPQQPDDSPPFEFDFELPHLLLAIELVHNSQLRQLEFLHGQHPINWTRDASTSTWHAAGTTGMHEISDGNVRAAVEKAYNLHRTRDQVSLPRDHTEMIEASERHKVQHSGETERVAAHLMRTYNGFNLSVAEPTPGCFELQAAYPDGIFPRGRLACEYEMMRMVGLNFCLQMAAFISTYSPAAAWLRRVADRESIQADRRRKHVEFLCGTPRTG